MDKLGNFVTEETYAILTLPNLSYSKTQHQVFAWIKVKIDVWHFPKFASRRN